MNAYVYVYAAGMRLTILQRLTKTVDLFDSSILFRIYLLFFIIQQTFTQPNF